MDTCFKHTKRENDLTKWLRSEREREREKEKEKERECEEVSEWVSEFEQLTL